MGPAVECPRHAMGEREILAKAGPEPCLPLCQGCEHQQELPKRARSRVSH